ncbi:YihY/virulence factor BrkB family protein [Conexibacter stalactiti]|uniref:YihY/virulence factor BrkB family protein n=1 Tax=Conexibacter stalactiti TaxID=1940611 RepID=A0ABU4HNK0_9ACTN|nr:YihY/virulence factor BrkB family protein [Conexibacter stalactiti]MDW5594888.1 YihY/virulence factor BrkB family protein [Conexibacter stalactiti]MEC5035530.1 YihY/virulence factor BrkB family protein [Conexibacter stalactiti]
MAQTRRRSGGLIGRLRGHRGGEAVDAAPPAETNPLGEPSPERAEAQDAAAAAEARAAADAPTPTDAEQVPTPAQAAETADRDPDAPDSPTDIEPRGWLATLKRAGKGFKEDGLQDWAAALTYYSVLSLFPLLIVLVALVGLFGEYPRTVNAMLDIVREVAPGSTADTVETSISGVVRDKGGAGALLGIGLVTALWTASGYIGAFMRAANGVYDVEETRPFWKLRPLQLAITAVMVVLIALLAIGFVVSGSVARALGDTIGLGDTAVTVWNVAKWPVMLLVAVVMIALLTWVGPNVKQPKLRWITPGAALGLGILILASVGFAFYVGNFGSYNATYGALGGVIVFLIWLWIANLALLFGVEVDAELERQRKLESAIS